MGVVIRNKIVDYVFNAAADHQLTTCVYTYSERGKNRGWQYITGIQPLLIYA